MSDSDDVHAADWWKDGKKKEEKIYGAGVSDDQMRLWFKMDGIEGVEQKIMQQFSGASKKKLLAQYKRVVKEGLWGTK